MLKYTTTQVTFSEIPDEITLCINISGCPIRCPDCHSKELWNDVGTELTREELYKLITNNIGISCVCIMGGDADYKSLEAILTWLLDYKYDNNKELKLAFYSGRDNYDDLYIRTGQWITYFDYLKVGSYKKELGGLNSPTTNQVLYQIKQEFPTKIYNITSKFWK